MQRSRAAILDIPVAPVIVRLSAASRNRTGRTWGMSDYQVGFIGSGNMGWPMAKNLLKAGGNILKAGHKLAVFDLDKPRVTKFVQGEANALAADNPAALAKASNVIITMLPTGPIEIGRASCRGRW